MTTIPNSQTERNTYIGGSDVGAILGLSPYKSAYDVWKEKVSPPQEQEVLTEPMQWGIEMEDAILGKYLKTIKASETPIKQFSAQDDTYPFLRGHIDAYFPEQKKVIEIKRVYSKKGWGQEGSDEIPAHYLTQVAWYTMLTEAECADIVMFCKLSDKSTVYTYQRNEALEASLKKKMVEFWKNHVEPQVPPPYQTQKDLIALFYPKEQSVSATPEVIETLQKMKELKEQIGAAEEQYEQLKCEVMNFMKESTLLVDGTLTPICTWKAMAPRNIVDLEKLKKDGLYETYTKKTQPARQFSIK